MAQVPAGKNRSGQLSKQTGDAWENQARRWLEGQGLRFIAANARERGGEIDLIMRDGAVIEAARADAQALLEVDPNLEEPDHVALAREVRLAFAHESAIVGG